MLWLMRAALVPICVVLGSASAWAGSNYLIDQRFGSIGFSVVATHLFDVDGQFQHFSGNLLLDLDHPAQSRIDVTVEAGSATISMPAGEGMMRSAAFLDPVHHPQVYFHSQTITEDGDRHYVIRGVLDMRGIARPVTLIASLKDRIDPAHLPASADFLATCDIDRTAFGMISDRDLVGNTVKLTIRLRLQLG